MGEGDGRCAETPMTCQFCNELYSRGRKGHARLQDAVKLSQQLCWDNPYRKSSEWREWTCCHSAIGYNSDSGLLSRECGGGSIHASPRIPCSARASALEVTMGISFIVSATSRKVVSLS